MFALLGPQDAEMHGTGMFRGALYISVSCTLREGAQIIVSCQANMAAACSEEPGSAPHPARLPHAACPGFQDFTLILTLTLVMPVARRMAGRAIRRRTP